MEEQASNRLISVLSEAVGLIQMLLYKEIRENLSKREETRDKTEIAMLAGAITGEVFGSQNPQTKFTEFRTTHWAEIEQELLCLSSNCPELCDYISDALRVQALCDYQLGNNSSHLLTRAKNSGYLVEDRDAPLPSVFMTSIRNLGKKNGLIIPPVEISAEEEQQLIN